MTVHIVISYLLYAIGMIAVFFFLLFLLLFFRREREEERRRKKTFEDIGDVTALFQTMRGIVEQQKQLAAAFNDELDKKMQMVKQVLSQSLDRNEELYERQRLLTRELETVSLELKSIQRQIGDMDEVLQAGKAYERPRRFNALQSSTECVPEAPSNPDKARDAFRVMLQSRTQEEDGPFHVAEKDSAGIEPPESAPTLQVRVEELYKSGLDAGAIAEKLNIGVGEVRLLLNLKDR